MSFGLHYSLYRIVVIQVSFSQVTGKDEAFAASRTWSVSKGIGTDYECEGFLYKKGGVVKNWKLRYFILDLDKRHVSQ